MNIAVKLDLGFGLVWEGGGGGNSPPSVSPTVFKMLTCHIRFDASSTVSIPKEINQCPYI